jgi:hypothetical protein
LDGGRCRKSGHFFNNISQTKNSVWGLNRAFFHCLRPQKGGGKKPSKHAYIREKVKISFVHGINCILLFAFSFSTCNRVCKRTAWILTRLRGCAGWSGSMLAANALCWFCRDAAHMLCFVTTCFLHDCIYRVVISWYLVPHTPYSDNSPRKGILTFCRRCHC